MGSTKQSYGTVAMVDIRPPRVLTAAGLQFCPRRGRSAV